MDNNSNISKSSENNSIQWRPNVITLGPGGAKGYLELGALLKLEQEGFFNYVTYWTGCSIGSAIALMIVCGYSIESVINDCIDFDILDDFMDINISDIMEKAGLITNKTMEKLLSLRVTQKFGFIPTLKQLYMATGLIYTTVAYNTDKFRPEYFNKDTEPHLSCVDASMMSMAMPLLIQPIKYKGDEYVDGAVGDPYPVLIHDNGNNHILGMYINFSPGAFSSNSRRGNKIPPILFKAFRVAQGTIRRLREQNMTWSSSNVKHLELSTPVLDSIGLTLDLDSRKAMIECGYKEAVIFLEKLQNPDKYKLLLEDNEEIPTVEELLSQEDLGNEMVQILNSLVQDIANRNGGEGKRGERGEGGDRGERGEDSQPINTTDVTEKYGAFESTETIFLNLTPEIERKLKDTHLI